MHNYRANRFRHARSGGCMKLAQLMRTAVVTAAILLGSDHVLAGPYVQSPGAPRDEYLQTAHGPTLAYTASYALVISASKYSHGWDPLEFNEGEANKLASALMSEGFIVNRLRDATSKELHSTLNDFVRQHDRPGARIIIFFTGHGYSNRTHLLGYIVPTDAPDPGVDPKGFGQKAISTEDLLRVSGSTKQARHILFVFDSCFSGAVFKTKGGPRHPPPLYVDTSLRDARQFLVSASEDQESPSESEFTPALIDGIKGRADYNHDGIVSGIELALWLQSVVTLTTPQYGDVQSHGGDILFRPVPGLPASTRLPQAQLPVAAEIGAATPEVADIYYYRKAADGQRVLEALQATKLTFETTRAQQPETYKTNTIACAKLASPSTMDEVRRLALQMEASGTPIYEIQQFRKKPNADARRVELLTSIRYDHTSRAALSSAQIAKMTTCPPALHN